MPRITRGRSRATLMTKTRGLAVGLAVALGTGCDQRERITFPTPTDGVGPVTTIDQPNGADTTVSAGDELFINGRTIDPDGVDTVYFFVIGADHGFEPFHPNPVRDTITFGVPIRTSGHAGQSFTVEIYGVDVLGNQGATSSRQINIRFPAVSY